MSERQTFVVRDDAIQARLVAHVHRMRQSGLTPQVLVSEYKAKRSLEQNSILHAVLSEIAVQQKWAGQSWTVEQWKRLMVAAWCRVRNVGVQLVPALDGQGFDVLYQHTSKLSVAECTDLLEFVLAWAAEQGVRIADPRQAA